MTFEMFMPIRKAPKRSLGGLNHSCIDWSNNHAKSKEGRLLELL